MVRAYHFHNGALRDGRPMPEIGEWLVHDGEIVICESGLHASRNPFDALCHAPGNNLDLVEVDQIVNEHDNKLVCRRRRRVASINAESILRYFARWNALKVVHLWEAPLVVQAYLIFGDESLMAAARDAARNAARAAASNAASNAAWAAAMDEFARLVNDEFKKEEQ